MNIYHEKYSSKKKFTYTLALRSSFKTTIFQVVDNALYNYLDITVCI